MKLALLKGNRFNPWHLEVFARMQPAVEVTAFRAESEIQRYFNERDDAPFPFPVEPIYFDTQLGGPIARLIRTVSARYAQRESRIVPFHDRLRDFDLIVSWELFTDWTEEALAAKKAYGVPVVLIVWDLIPFNMERDPRRAMLKQRALEEADAFLVYTERSRRMLLLEGADPGKIVVAPPGIDLEVFRPGPGDRAAFGLPHDAFLILFVGWLLPRKGIDWLLYAVRELADADSGRQPHLWIVGSGPGRERVQAIIERLRLGQCCTFADSFPYRRMPDVYRAADVFVLPSIATNEWQEQFGMSLIEAMACGIPTVSTSSGAIPEIVGDGGHLVQPNDFVSLSDVLSKLMTDKALAARSAANARERARQFDVEVQANQLERAFVAVCRHESDST